MENYVDVLSTTPKDAINIKLYLYPIEDRNKTLLILKQGMIQIS